MLRNARLSGLLALSLVLPACDNGTGPELPGPPSQMVVVSGDDQEGRVMTALPLPLIAKVTDSAGVAIVSQLVNFRVVSGGGQVFAGAALTNDQGIAQEIWTLGPTAGEQIVEARAVDSGTGAPLVFARFTANATPDVASDFQVFAGNGQTGAVSALLGTPPQVRIRDQFGNPVPNITVTWTAASGSGTTAPPTSVTDSLGIARTAWQLGPIAGTHAMTAAAAGLTAVVFNATAVAGAPAQITITPVNPAVRVHDAIAFTAAVVDAAGNPIGRQVTWSSTNANIITIDASGVARALGAGSADVRATIDNITATSTVSVAPAPVSSVTITPDTATIEAGSNTTLAAVARDVAGNILADRTFTWTTDAPDIAAISDGSVTGIAAGVAIITATSEGKSGSSTITVVPPPPVIDTVVVNPDTAKLNIDDQAQLSALAYGAGGTALYDRVVSSWTTSNASVATVTSDGLVTAVAPGTAIIMATIEDKTGTARITVAPPPPVINIIAPVQYEAANPNLRIVADCVGPHGPTCVSMRAYLYSSAGAQSFPDLVTGTTRLDGTVNVASYARSTPYSLRVETTTASGVITVASRLIYAMNNPALVEVATVGGKILGANETHILYEFLTPENVRKLGLRNRVTGTDSVLMDLSGFISNVHLGSVGVVLNLGGRLYDVRPGSVTEFATISAQSGSTIRNYFMQGAGNFVIWLGTGGGGAGLMRYDLATRQVVTIDPTPRHPPHDVAPNGDVAYWKGNYIFFYSGGTSTQLTTNTLLDAYPILDGDRIVFTRLTSSNWSLVMLQSGVETVIAPAISSSPPPGAYVAANGWIAYQTNTGELFVRSPNGHATLIPGGGTLQALGPDGTLVFGRAGGQLLISTPPHAGSVVLGLLQEGIALIIDGRVHVALGNRLFAVQY